MFVRSASNAEIARTNYETALQHETMGFSVALSYTDRVTCQDASRARNVPRSTSRHGKSRVSG